MSVNVDSFAMEEDSCRLCLNPNPTVKVFFNDLVVHKIQICCNIQVDVNDKLPKYICILCSEELNNIIKFKNMCEYNDKFLREKLYIDVKVELNTSEDLTEVKCEISDECSTDEDVSNGRENLSSDLENDKEENNYISIVDPKVFQKISSNPSFKLTKCELCGRKINKRNAKFHISNNLDDSKIHCKYCNSQCVTKICYRTHKKNHRIVDESLITRPKIRKVENNCFFCGMFFNNVSKFAKHLRDHNPQPYQCDICCKSFKFKVHLIKHLQSHIKVTRSCICHHCGKMFKNPYIAQKHIKSHLMSDLVKCEVCGKMMKKASVKQHAFTHKGEKNFECDICKQKFISKTCVNSHMVTHTGSKQFECNFCGVKFASRKTFSDHEKLHTGERPHNCPVCNKGFIQLSNMKSHFRNNHKGVEFVYKNKRELKREMLVL